ncbi:hypothetical protein CBFG_01549 [Clostridiales bacterium 1_7_47FAA]|nr:hypothetical protein CBFG_01549 [Clostridiales bacterium 1_7_47FAA]
MGNGERITDLGGAVYPAAGPHDGSHCGGGLYGQRHHGGNQGNRLFGEDTHGRAGDCAVGHPMPAGLLVVCDRHGGRGRLVGTGPGPGSGLLCGLPGHVRLGEAGTAVGKIQTSGRKRMNDAVTIGMAATAVGTVLWFLVKMMIDDFKRSVSGVGSKLDSTIARFDERVTKLEDKQEADIKAVQKELSSIKGDFATTFVLREDFFRSMNGVEDKMRSMDSKLDRLLVRQGGKTDG